MTDVIVTPAISCVSFKDRFMNAVRVRQALQFSPAQVFDAPTRSLSTSNDLSASVGITLIIGAAWWLHTKNGKNAIWAGVVSGILHNIAQRMHAEGIRTGNGREVLFADVVELAL
jgi:hypothetical protein